MDTYKGMPFCQVILVDSSSNRALTIGFLGFSYEGIEKYMSDNYVECDKPYARQWTEMKYLTT